MSNRHQRHGRVQLEGFDVLPDVSSDGPGILQRTEVTDVFVPDQTSSDKGLGERWSHARRVRTRLVVTDSYDDGGREVLDGAEFDIATILEHLGFYLGKAFQTDGAVRLVGEAVVDIAGEEAGMDLVERRPAGVSVQDLGTRLELDAPPPRGIAHHVLAFGGEVVGKDDWFEQEERGEQPRHVSFGEQQGGAAHGVPEAVNRC